MRKFVTLDCLVDTRGSVSINQVAQNRHGLRHAILVPVSYRINIQEALRQVDFQFHRSYSLINLIGASILNINA